MTDEQINTAIAEACGITQRDQYGTLYRSDSDGWSYNCPDYCNDLNAMHEAENLFTPERNHWQYYALLDDMCGTSFKAMRATARQRAEAFLRVLDKWEEAK